MKDSMRRFCSHFISGRKPFGWEPKIRGILAIEDVRIPADIDVSNGNMEVLPVFDGEPSAEAVAALENPDSARNLILNTSEFGEDTFRWECHQVPVPDFDAIVKVNSPSQQLRFPEPVAMPACPSSQILIEVPDVLVQGGAA